MLFSYLWYRRYYDCGSYTTTTHQYNYNNIGKTTTIHLYWWTFLITPLPLFFYILIYLTMRIVGNVKWWRTYAHNVHIFNSWCLRGCIVHSKYAEQLYCTRFPYRAATLMFICECAYLNIRTQVSYTPHYIMVCEATCV